MNHIQGRESPAGLSSLEMTRAQKYERAAFNFCKLGTTGILCWLLTPPLFVLVVSLVIIGLYGKALGLVRSRCFLRKPLLNMGFWSLVVVIDAAWLIYSHPYW